MNKNTLGNIISISKGKKHSISNIPCASSKRIIGIVDLRNNNNLVYTDDKHGTEATNDDILIAWDGANAGTIGYGKKGYIGSTIARLRIKEPLKFYTPFIGMLLKTQFEYLRGSTTGATIPHVSRDALEKIKLPIISYNDQIRIATVLTRAERLIAKRKESIKALDELLKSTFLEMFGDPVRNEKGWEKKTLKTFGQIITGNTPPRNNDDNYSSNFIEWIKTDNIVTDQIHITVANEFLSETGLQKARFVTSGALLVACIAGSVESIGRAAIADRKVSFNQQINAIQPNDEIDSLFLCWLFKISKLYIQSHATKGMKKILTKGDFEKILMVTPPLILQNQFAAIVEKVESIKAKQTQSLAELENLYASLSQRAFKGELDLCGVGEDGTDLVAGNFGDILPNSLTAPIL